jgi:hypothetical protein
MTILSIACVSGWRFRNRVYTIAGRGRRDPCPAGSARRFPGLGYLPLCLERRCRCCHRTPRKSAHFPMRQAEWLYKWFKSTYGVYGRLKSSDEALEVPSVTNASGVAGSILAMYSTEFRSESGIAKPVAGSTNWNVNVPLSPVASSAIGDSPFSNALPMRGISFAAFSSV